MWDGVLHIFEWMQHPIDSTRPHDIEPYIAWHARLMVLAWGILFPIGILIARFFKITPKQNFPKQLDNRFWWHSHLILQILGSIIAIIAFIFVLTYDNKRNVALHETLGWITMIGLCVQVLLGLCRGSSGGYASTHGTRLVWGHHYYMTAWRYFFEYTHKNLGYALLLLSWITGATGMWSVNAPIWMWIILGIWLVVLITVFIYLQYRGYAIDTYEAIWGLDTRHPGNTKNIVKFGVRRLRLEQEGKVQKKTYHMDFLTQQDDSDTTQQRKYDKNKMHNINPYKEKEEV